MPRFIVSLGLINTVLRLFKPFTYRTSRLTKTDSMETCCVRCTRNHEVFDNSFKQTLHHMNQPYLVWAAVFSWFRPGHILTPSGNWVPNCVTMRGCLSYPDDVAHEDEVQPAYYINYFKSLPQQTLKSSLAISAWTDSKTNQRKGRRIN